MANVTTETKNVTIRNFYNSTRFIIQTDPKAGQFYILPKIHKQGNLGGRPIVFSNSHLAERISEFVDYHLKYLVQTTQSFIKDTTHFLNKLQKLGQLPNNAILVALEVSSLYTIIPHNEGINACRHFFHTPNRTPSTTSDNKTLCDLIRMILTMNNFKEKHHLQTQGIAMGTRMAPFLRQSVSRQINLRRTDYYVLHSNHT